MSYKQKCVWKYLLVLCDIYIDGLRVRSRSRGTKALRDRRLALARPRATVVSGQRRGVRGSLDWAVSVMLGNGIERPGASSAY